MLKLLALGCFLLAGHVSAQTRPPSEIDKPSEVPKKAFPTLSEIPSFHSRITRRSLDSQQDQFMEEYYDRKQNRGRFNADTILEESRFYDGKTMQETILSSSVAGTVICGSFDVPVDYDAIVSPINEIMDQGTKEKPALVLGPSAMWVKFARMFTENPNEKYTYVGSKEIRGIAVDEWQISKEMQGGTIAFTFWFMTEEWLRHEKIDVPVPVRFHMIGTIKRGVQSFTFNTQFDYYLFEPFTNTWEQFGDLVGVGCVGNKSPKGKEFENVRTNIPNQFSTTLETQSHEIKGGVSTGFKVHKHDLYLDADLKIARWDSFDPSKPAGKTSIIQDLRRGIAYTKNDGTCTPGQVETRVFLKTNNLHKVVRSVQEILHFDGDYHYVGQSGVRGIVTDVWERIMPNGKDFYAYEPNNLFSQISKGVITHHFTNLLESPSFDAMGRVPVKTVVTGFRKVVLVDPRFVGRGLLTYQLIYREEINYFGFMPLTYGRSYLDLFDIKDCYPLSSQRKYYDLYIPTTDEVSTRLSTRTTHIREQAAQALIDALDISPLRIPLLDVNFDEKGFYLYVLLLERAQSSLSFSDLADFRPTSSDKVQKAIVDIEKCAQKALDAKTPSSFIYCMDGKTYSCYLTERRSNDKSGQPIKEISDAAICSLYQRAAEGTAGAILLTEAKLAEVDTNLIELVKTEAKGDGLTFELTETIDKKQVKKTYKVTDLAEGSDPSDLSNKQRNFVESLSGYVIKEDTETAAMADKVTSLGDCYTECRGEATLMNCQSFSYCRRADNKIECTLSSALLSPLLEDKERDSLAKLDTQCTVYTRSYIKRFTKMQGIVSLTPGGQKVDKVTSAEACAQECTFSATKDCESFELCDDESCVLRKEHYIDLKDQKDKIKNTVGCALYTLNYVNDYANTGEDLIVEEKPINRFPMLSIEECAARCSKEAECKSINYCPLSVGDQDCTLTRKSVFDKDAKMERRPFCRNYEKSYKPAALEASVNSWSGGGLFALVFFMFCLGVGLGIGGWFGHGYYKQRQEGPQGLGLNASTVSFNRHRDEVDSNA